MRVTKRDGRQVDFDKSKIFNAVFKAFSQLNKPPIESTQIAGQIAEEIESEYKDGGSVEDIQDMVEHKLMGTYYKDVAKAYITYRYQKNQDRVLQGNLETRYERLQKLITGKDEESNKENSNKDTRIIPTMRDYIAGFTCRELASKVVLPQDIAKAHEEGIIHYHDTDYSPVMPMTNCCLINLEDMLQNSTVISGVKINKPHSFRTACTITTQIITQVASSQYGGNTITLSHLAPFVDISRKNLKEKHPELTPEQIERFIEDEIRDGVQTIQYQLITMSTTNGQAPFTSMFMWINEVEDAQTKHDLALIIEEVLRQRIAGVPNEQDAPITVAFPKLLYCLDDNNIKEGTEYWYLTELAAECSAKRLVPDYISAKKMRELKGDVYPCMGCRSFLTPDPINHKYYSRFNQGVVTLNLVDVALSSNKDMKDFWRILDERLNLCYKALMTRHNSLKGTLSDVAPILWQHGAYARLKPGEKIDKLLFNNYSTISLGYAGLYECIHYMTGGSQLDKEGKAFGLSIMKKLNDTCFKWRELTNISFSLYGSPIESTTYKFAKCLRKRFGVIPGVTDKDYVTNSYHITPSQKIDAFSKLKIEGEFQEFSPGGNICYVETPNMTKNIPALLEIIKYIYETNMYAEINTMTSYCHVCGCTDIYMGDDLEFHCPQCGNNDYNKMNVALRICGYISTNPFNKGRANDIHDRVYHIGD
nr:MAG TPA: anaerobic ribonucleoside triphosphate reductase [Caudoviricetes sp.]